MNRICNALLALILACALPLAARAEPDGAAPKQAAPNAENPEIEQRMVRLAEDLRCLVCQNESLAGSKAELAEDLRREIRGQMLAGKTDPEVIDYLTARYGDFVLYRPPFKPVTWLLWLGPVVFLGAGGAAWYVTLRRRRAAVVEPPDAQKLAAAAQLLKDDQ